MYVFGAKYTWHEPLHTECPFLSLLASVALAQFTTLQPHSLPDSFRLLDGNHQTPSWLYAPFFKLFGSEKNCTHSSELCFWEKTQNSAYLQNPCPVGQSICFLTLPFYSVTYSSSQIQIETYGENMFMKARIRARRWQKQQLTLRYSFILKFLSAPLEDFHILFALVIHLMGFLEILFWWVVFVMQLIEQNRNHLIAGCDSLCLYYQHSEGRARGSLCPWVPGQPGLHSKLQANQSDTSCLNKQTNNYLRAYSNRFGRVL